MSSQDPFARYKEMIMAGTDKIRETINKLAVRKQDEAQKTFEYIQELKADAAECQLMMSNESFQSSQKFMETMRAGFSKALETIEPSNPYEIARIQGKIELFDALISRPERIIKEYEVAMKLKRGSSQ